MWIKLSGEYVNLDHIVRVRANRANKGGQSEWVVELEGIIKGELTYFTRYRGIDAEIIIHALEIHSQHEKAPAAHDPNAPHQASRNTLHDVKVM